MERPLNGYLLVLASALLLGTLGMFSRLFYDEGGEPFTLLVLRFAGAGPALPALGARARRGIGPGLAAGLCVACVILAARHLMVSRSLPPVLLSGLMFTSPLLVLVPVAAARGIDLGLSLAARAAAAGAIVVRAGVPIALFYT